MRELKFRMYYYNAENKHEFEYFDAYSEFCEDTWRGDIFPENLEQYTGLKDKNGKEIYEGDIVEEIISGLYGEDTVARYEVYWDCRELKFGIRQIVGPGIHDELWECNGSLEIIGNIHEGALDGQM